MSTRRYEIFAAAALLLFVAYPTRAADGKALKSGAVAKAGVVQILEFEKDQAVCYARIVVSSGTTSKVTDDYFAGDYGKILKVGIVEQHGLEARFFVTVAVSNESTYLSANYPFAFDARGGITEYIGPRAQTFSDSSWTKVYSHSERYPPSEMRIELRACKDGKPVK
jgi:hypothetical protein